MFEIRFQGVMTFAFLKDAAGNDVCRVPMYEVPLPHPPHRPVLTVNTADIVPRPDTSSAAVCYPLEGKVTTDLPPGVPTSKLDGLLRISDLISSTSAGIPDPAIAQSIPTPEFPTIVELAAGTLTILHWFYETAIIDGAAAQCIARTVCFTAPASRDVTITINAGSASPETVVVRPNAVVHMTCLPVVPVDHSHHQVMVNFFEPPVGAPRTLVRSDMRCDRFVDPAEVNGCLTGRDFSVECANTRFP